MITLTIEKKQYTAPQYWDEITLGTFIRLCKIEIPEKLRNLWIASASDDNAQWKKADDAIGDQETIKIFPAYYGRVMALLTDIPQGVINRIHGPLREELFNKHLRHFIHSMFTHYPVHIVAGKLEIYQPEPAESFTLNDVEYFMPETLKVYGDEIPLGREQTITFTEASDIELALRNMAEGAVERLPMFVAIYCRPKDEEYDEIKTMHRADTFKDMKMDDVWRVFFCISERLTRYQRYIQWYSEELVAQAQEKLLSPV